MHASLDTLVLHVRVYAGNMHNSLSYMGAKWVTDCLFVELQERKQKQYYMRNNCVSELYSVRQVRLIHQPINLDLKVQKVSEKKPTQTASLGPLSAIQNLQCTTSSTLKIERDIQGGPERTERLWALITRSKFIQIGLIFISLGRKLCFHSNDTLIINFGQGVWNQ